MREIGIKLKVARESQQITLDLIAEKTKINKQHLKNIEEGFWDFLPEPYIKGIIQQYADVVQLDGKELYHEYQMHQLQEMQQLAATPPEIEGVISADEAEVTEPPHGIFSNRTNKGLIAIALTLLLIVIAFLLNSKFKKGPDELQLQSVSPTISDSLATPDTLPTVSISSPRPLDLEIRAIDDTWLEISIDDSTSEEVTFSPRTSRTWQGQKKFAIFLGNAAGVEFYLNGEKLNFKGQKGRVVNLEITQEGIVRK